MAHIEVIGKPKGASERYQFLKNKETGREWKALLDLRTARPAMTTEADVELAPAELAVTVTVSPVDARGKALREDGKPIVIDSWTHTFTSTEMLTPDFDPEKRIMEIVAERVHIGEARLKGQDQLKEFVGKWGGKTKIKTPPVKFEGKETIYV